MLPFYFEVARTAFRRQLVYRWSNLAGLATNIFFGCLFSYVLIAFYQARPVVLGYDITDTLHYTWMAQALLMVVSPFGWLDLMMTIRTGEVVSDLSKPCDFYGYWFSREMGRSIYYVVFRGVPIYIAGMLIFGYGIPTQWQSWLAFLLALTFGIMLGIAYRVLYSLAAFWIIEGRALVTMAVVIANYFTGLYVPIYLLPEWLRIIAEWLPFNGLVNLPILMLLGKLNNTSILFELVRQLGWLLVFTLLVRMLTGVATRRVVAQGG